MLTNKEWIKLIEDNRSIIEKKGLEQFRESLSRADLSGWYVGVEISESGNVHCIGHMLPGSITMASYEGTAMIVVRFAMKGYEFHALDLAKYNIPDLKEFKEYIVSEYDIDTEAEDFELQIQDKMILEVYNEFKPGTYAKLEAEDLEWYINEYGEEAVTEKIDQTIAELELYADCQ